MCSPRGLAVKAAKNAENFTNHRSCSRSIDLTRSSLTIHDRRAFFNPTTFMHLNWSGGRGGFYKSWNTVKSAPCITNVKQTRARDPIHPSFRLVDAIKWPEVKFLRAATACPEISQDPPCVLQTIGRLDWPKKFWNVANRFQRLRVLADLGTSVF